MMRKATMEYLIDKYGTTPFKIFLKIRKETKKNQEKLFDIDDLLFSAGLQAESSVGKHKNIKIIKETFDNLKNEHFIEDWIQISQNTIYIAF